MEENKIPTAKEMLHRVELLWLEEYVEEDVLNFTLEFAKMHVKKQQEEIINKVTANGYIRTDLIDFIPKCYPLENIK